MLAGTRQDPARLGAFSAAGAFDGLCGCRRLVPGMHAPRVAPSVDPECVCPEFVPRVRAPSAAVFASLLNASLKGNPAADCYRWKPSLWWRTRKALSASHGWRHTRTSWLREPDECVTAIKEARLADLCPRPLRFAQRDEGFRAGGDRAVDTVCRRSPTLHAPRPRPLSCWHLSAFPLSCVCHRCSVLWVSAL